MHPPTLVAFRKELKFFERKWVANHQVLYQVYLSHSEFHSAMARQSLYWLKDS